VIIKTLFVPTGGRYSRVQPRDPLLNSLEEKIDSDQG